MPLERNAMPLERNAMPLERNAMPPGAERNATGHRGRLACFKFRFLRRCQGEKTNYPPVARRASAKPARHVRSVLPNAEALHPAMRAASACRRPSTSTRRAASRWGHQAEQYKTELFFPAGDVLIQQSAHPLWAAKLQPSFTLGLCVGAPGHRGWPGRCWGAPCPLSLTASHAA